MSKDHDLVEVRSFTKWGGNENKRSTLKAIREAIATFDATLIEGSAQRIPQAA